MIEKPAKGTKGYLFFNIFTEKYFLRVYNEQDVETRKTKKDYSYKDYVLGAEEIEVELLANCLSLYENEDKNKLDWSSKVLGRA
jgi:hypothetical protein